MRIVCVTSTFPTKSRFWRGAFVRNFCLELETLGASVSAIVPEGWHAVAWAWVGERLFGALQGEERIDTVYAAYPSLSVLAGKNRILAAIDRALCRRSVEFQLNKLSPKPDLVYAHFIVSGLLVVEWCKRNRVKLIVVSGESSYEKFFERKCRIELARQVASFDQLFFVSERNQKGLSTFLRTDKLFGALLPNAVDGEIFKPRDKAECRKKLGLSQDRVIGVFVGYFVDRKGPLRVLQAMERVDNVYGVFIGKGDQIPKGEKVLHSGLIENDDMPIWLAAADFFVLPSFQEGRSNAVLEALACGLPLVVSNRDFNREFLNEECALFVDPESIDDIANAMSELAENPEKREAMGKLGREHSRNFSQRERARKFIFTASTILNDSSSVTEIRG